MTLNEKVRRSKIRIEKLVGNWTFSSFHAGGFGDRTLIFFLINGISTILIVSYSSYSIITCVFFKNSKSKYFVVTNVLSFIYYVVLIISHYFVVITTLVWVLSFSNYLKMLYFKSMICQKQYFCLVHEMWVRSEYIIAISRPHVWNYTKYITVIVILNYMCSRSLIKNR